jgi:hypothetical protein
MDAAFMAAQVGADATVSDATVSDAQVSAGEDSRAAALGAFKAADSTAAAAGSTAAAAGSEAAVAGSTVVEVADSTAVAVADSTAVAADTAVVADIDNEWLTSGDFGSGGKNDENGWQRNCRSFLFCPINFVPSILSHQCGAAISLALGLTGSLVDRARRYTLTARKADKSCANSTGHIMC